MTGKEWDSYFKELTPEYRAKLLHALKTLASDKTFQKAFGPSFTELAFLIEWPLSNSKPH